MRTPQRNTNLTHSKTWRIFPDSKGRCFIRPIHTTLKPVGGTTGQVYCIALQIGFSAYQVWPAQTNWSFG